MKAPAITGSTPRDPRVIGGRYRSYYWATEYSVLAIKFSAHGFLDSITVQDDRGSRTHGTAWDERDQILFDPRTKAG
ncbi:hypothetical protein [Mycobacterium lentiflavum]|nr:hypothetical protein [Mycobacterium lentiflavum]